MSQNKHEGSTSACDDVIRQASMPLGSIGMPPGGPPTSLGIAAASEGEPEDERDDNEADPQGEPDHRLMTPKEVAAYLAVCLRTISNLAARDELIPVEIGGAVRYEKCEVDAYIRKRKRRRKPQPPI